MKFGKTVQRMVGSVKSWWVSLSLDRQFALLSTLLVIAGLGTLGFWVSAKIEDGIKIDVSTRAALYMQNIISPQLQGLASTGTLAPDVIRRLDIEMARDRQTMQLLEARVWNPEGTIVYSTNQELIGRSYPPTREFAKALAGSIEVELEDELTGHHGEPVPVSGKSLLEIYVPIHKSGGSEIIAIAEFYQDADVIRNEINSARAKSWGVTALVSFGIIAGLYTVVMRGSHIIEFQRRALDSRIQELTELVDQNRELHRKVQLASQRTAEDHEIFVRRIGSDLHDGIGQLLTIIMLRLEGLFGTSKRSAAEYKVIHDMLQEAMAEVRDLSAGLALPEIQALPLADALQLIINRHVRRTGNQVDAQIDVGTIEIAQPIKLCLCRFVQEGLSNAFRHAGGAGQKVVARIDRDDIVVEVSDTGPGISARPRDEKRPALGLVGLRHRLESLGGRLSVMSEAGKGTRLRAIMPLSIQEIGNGE